MSLLQIHPADNVAVDTETGHKQALKAIPAGEKVIKYGFPIGYASEDIEAGAAVHSHNLKTALGEKTEYTYTPDDTS